MAADLSVLRPLFVATPGTTSAPGNVGNLEGVGVGDGVDTDTYAAATTSATTSTSPNLSMPNFSGVVFSDLERAAATLPVDDGIISARTQLSDNTQSYLTAAGKRRTSTDPRDDSDLLNQLLLNVAQLAAGQTLADVGALNPSSGNIQTLGTGTTASKVTINWGSVESANTLLTQFAGLPGQGQIAVFVNRLRVLNWLLTGNIEQLRAPQVAESEKTGGLVRPGNAITAGQTAQLCQFVQSIISECPGMLPFIVAQLALTPLGNTDLAKNQVAKIIPNPNGLVAWMYNAVLDDSFSQMQEAWVMMDPHMRLASIAEFKTEAGAKTGPINIGQVVQAEMRKSDFMALKKLSRSEFLLAFTVGLIKMLGTIPNFEGIIHSVSKTGFERITAYYNSAMKFYDGDVSDLEFAFDSFVKEVGVANGVTIDDSDSGRLNRAGSDMSQAFQDDGEKQGIYYSELIANLPPNEKAALISFANYDHTPDFRPYLMPAQAVTFVNIISKAKPDMPVNDVRKAALRLLAKGVLASRNYLNENPQATDLVNIRFDHLVGKKNTAESDADFATRILSRANGDDLPGMRSGSNGLELYWG